MPLPLLLVRGSAMTDVIPALQRRPSHMIASDSILPRVASDLVSIRDMTRRHPQRYNSIVSHHETESNLVQKHFV